MPLSVKSLPVLQNWDCHSCGDCCRQYAVTVTEEEQQRILSQGWESDEEMRHISLFVRDGGTFSKKKKLNHRPDGACVFLNEEGRCRIHAKFGSAGKPLACRVYPFMLVPTGDHWRVGVRFYCPSAAANNGRPLVEHLAEIREYSAMLETREGFAGRVLAPPLLDRGRSAPWPDLFRFAKVFRQILQKKNAPFEFRIRHALALLKICRESHFDTISGRQLEEFLDVISEACREDVPIDPASVAVPSGLGRVLFRQFAALYSRKDSGTHRGLSRNGRMSLLWAALRFARGKGRVPTVHGRIGEITFARTNESSGPLTSDEDALLSRFYAIKLESMQFAGPTNFNRMLFDGLDSLFLTFPAILWLARVFSASMPRDEAFRLAVSSVDDNFGFNPLLGSKRQLRSQRFLSNRDEIARLSAYYSK